MDDKRARWLYRLSDAVSELQRLMGVAAIWLAYMNVWALWFWWVLS